MSSALSLFPARIRFVNQDGTLTPEALRVLDMLVTRVGGTLGDTGVDVFATPEQPDEGAPQDLQQSAPAGQAGEELVLQPVPATAGTDLVLQHAPYSPGAGLSLLDYRFALTDTPVSPGTYGSAGSVAVLTVDQQGRATFAQNVEIGISASQVTGLGTMATQNTGANFNGSFTGKTVTVTNGIITSVA